MVILDCDIASCLAKINRIDLLGVAFPDCEAYITESVSIELLRSSQAGFSFPDRIFESIPVISLNQDERIMLQGMPKNRSIHFGEAEGVIISKNRNGIFLTNDSRVVRHCQDNEALSRNQVKLSFLLAINCLIPDIIANVVA
jgi:predicted nucleic acid-binding protein